MLSPLRLCASPKVLNMKMYVPPLIRISTQLVYSSFNKQLLTISLDNTSREPQIALASHCNSHREMSMRKKSSSSLLRATTAILTLIAFALSLLGSSSWHELSLGASPQSPQLATTSTQGDTTHTLYCGLWRTDGGFVSTIRIKNSLVVAPLEVNPKRCVGRGACVHRRASVREWECGTGLSVSNSWSRDRVSGHARCFAQSELCLRLY